METIIVLLQLIGMSVLITLVIFAGFYTGIILVDFASGGEVSKLFRRLF